MKLERTLAAIAFVAVLAGGCSSSDSNSGDVSTDATVEDASAESPADSSAESSTDASPEAPVAEDPEPTCAYKGVDQGGDIEAELTFENSLGAEDLDITYAMLDNGTRFFTDTAFATLSRPNEKFRITPTIVDELPPDIDESTIECTVLAIEEGLGLGDIELGTDADTCTFQSVDESQGIGVELELTSPFETATNVVIWYAVMGPDAVRFDTSTARVDLMGAGETVRLNEYAPAYLPDWVEADQITCDVLGFEAKSY